MSWDIFAQDLPRDAKSIKDIPEGFLPASIGERSAIIAKIKEVVPSADFSEPSWGLIDGDGWFIEVNIGESEICRGFAFHVRGGDAAAGVVAAVLQHLNLRAIDSQAGDFFIAGPEAIDSFHRWRAYRNQVLADPSVVAASRGSNSRNPTNRLSRFRLKIFALVSRWNLRRQR
jgi:hypothetical protein